jgi:pimeloyl-ACP methyl ester carboxylesterase
MLKGALTILSSVLVIYAALLIWLYFRQESLLFFPTPLAADYPLATQPDVQEHAVDVPGARLSVLQLKLPHPKGVVFYLHGNAGNLAGWFSNADFYRQANFDLVMLDYRGYGKSTGRIESLDQLRGDVQAVWSRFAPAYRDKRIVVIGRSLGTGLAAEHSARLQAEGRRADLTVLVSPYASLRQLTAEFYPFVPSLLLRYPLDNTEHLPKVGGPIYLMHGEQDDLIKVSHSRQLHQLVPAAKLLVVPDAGHNDIHEFDGYLNTLRAALAQL